MWDRTYVLRKSDGRSVICFGMLVPVRNWHKSLEKVLQLKSSRWYFSALVRLWVAYTTKRKYRQFTYVNTLRWLSIYSITTSSGKKVSPMSIICKGGPRCVPPNNLLSKGNRLQMNCTTYQEWTPVFLDRNRIHDHKAQQPCAKCHLERIA